MGFEVSGLTMAGFVRALEAEKLLEPVRAKLGFAARSMLDDPHASRWHEGKLNIEFLEAVLAVAGPAKLEQLNRELTSKSFGPIIKPLARVALAIGGSSPATVFSRVNEAVSVGTRGLTISWKAASETSGEVALEYAEPVPARIVEPSWRGVLAIAEELTGRKLRFDRFESTSPTRHVFHVSW
ncbi:MAG: hypothetical protein ACOZQL_18425 [Myxococcota bacterium]